MLRDAYYQNCLYSQMDRLPHTRDQWWIYLLLNSRVFYCTYHVDLFSSRVILKKSVTKLPRVEVEEMGPSFDLTVRRTRLASDHLYRESCRKPKAAKVFTRFFLFFQGSYQIFWRSKMGSIHPTLDLKTSASGSLLKLELLSTWLLFLLALSGIVERLEKCWMI